MRTKRRTRDPLLWLHTHRLFGAMLVASGVRVGVAAFLVPPYALVVAVAGLLLSCVAVAVYLMRTPQRPRVAPVVLL